MKEKSILLTATLVLSMMLAGCSKEEESMEEKIVQDMKQHIVGVWEHDGDFVCKDLSELSGTIKDGILYGCDSEFGAYTPSTLTIRADGSFELNRHEWKIMQGTYVCDINSNNGESQIGFLYGDYIFSDYADFYYRKAFFEEDYNTVYLVAYSWATIVARYRRR